MIKMVDNKPPEDYLLLPSVFTYFEIEFLQSKIQYRDFIASKDLGLLPGISKASERDYTTFIYTDYYEIIDEKKWVISKLKYGI